MVDSHSCVAHSQSIFIITKCPKGVSQSTTAFECFIRDRSQHRILSTSAAKQYSAWLAGFNTYLIVFPITRNALKPVLRQAREL